MLQLGKLIGKIDKDKAVALTKRLKIEDARQKMFIAIIIAAMVLGITAVATVYLIKSINFNAKVIGKKAQIIEKYKKNQTSIEALKKKIDILTDNDNLEVVARQRGEECKNKERKENGGKDYGTNDIEIARTCSALRVIPDALPSARNDEAMMSSLNQLLYISKNTIGIEGMTADQSGSMRDWKLKDPRTGKAVNTVHGMGASIVIKDDANTVRSALNTIEKSIRNYDMRTASIIWSNQEGGGKNIELSATFGAYYSDRVEMQKEEMVICADSKNAKCKQAGGDSSSKGKKQESKKSSGKKSRKK